MSEDLMPKNEAIKRHLRKPQDEKGFVYYSSFRAALDEARCKTNRDQHGQKKPGEHYGSWLGAICYLLLLDQIGKCFRPQNKNPITGGNAIERALSYFTNLDVKDKRALYALRCGFAHDFSLINIPPGKNPDPLLFHWFTVDQKPDGNVVRLPAEPWDGEYKHINIRNCTMVSLLLLGDLVEDICKQIFDLAERGELEIELCGGSDEMLYRYSILTPAR